MRKLPLILAVPLIAAACGGSGGGKVTTNTKIGEQAARPIAITEPTAGDSVHSPLTVSGTTDYFKKPIKLVLSAGKKHLATKQVTSQLHSGEQATFNTTLTYRVSKKTGGQLLVFTNSANKGRLPVAHVPLELLP